MANLRSASSSPPLPLAPPGIASLTCAWANRSDSSDMPEERTTGDETSEPLLRGEDGPSERDMRSGVLHALRTDSGLPEIERCVGVELIEGKCDGSSREGASWLLLALREDDNELERENEPGLPLDPASNGSGRRRGDTWTLPTVVGFRGRG